MTEQKPTPMDGFNEAIHEKITAPGKDGEPVDIGYQIKQTPGATGIRSITVAAFKFRLDAVGLYDFAQEQAEVSGAPGRPYRKLFDFLNSLQFIGLDDPRLAAMVDPLADAAGVTAEQKATLYTDGTAQEAP